MLLYVLCIWGYHKLCDERIVEMTSCKDVYLLNAVCKLIVLSLSHQGVCFEVSFIILKVHDCVFVCVWWFLGGLRTYMKPCSCHGLEIKDQIILLGIY